MIGCRHFKQLAGAKARVKLQSTSMKAPRSNPADRIRKKRLARGQIERNLAAPTDRPIRRSLHVQEMDEELVLSLQSANTDHLSEKPRKLTI